MLSLGHHPSVLPEELSGLVYRSLRPDSQLVPWIDHYWYAYAPAPLAEKPFNFYADGGSTLIFDLSDTSAARIHYKSSLNLVPIQELFSGPIAYFGIRFRPGGSYGLLGLAPDEIELPVKVNDQLETLHQQLSELRGITQLALLTDQWLSSLAHKQTLMPGIVQKSLTILQQQPFFDYEALQQQGIHRRRLERAFSQHTGLSPGRLKQLTQVKLARLLLRDSNESSLTDIALACKFYDQAHFSHQFRRWVNTTPSIYRERKLSQIYKRSSPAPE